MPHPTTTDDHQLGTVGVVSSQLSQIAPATVIFGVVGTALATTGLIGVPIAMIAVAVSIGLFLVGYVAMARHVHSPGAFYAYIARGLWKPLGVGAAYVAVLSYLAFALASTGGFGFTFGNLFATWTGVTVDWWVFATIAALAVGILGIRRIDITGKVLAVFVIAETVVVAISTIATIAAPGFHLTADAVKPNQLWASGGSVLFVIGVTAFVGAEAAPAYIKEARDPRRTVPRASFITLAVAAAVYFLASWVEVSGGGADVIDRAGKEGPDLFGNLAAASLGHWAVGMNQLLFSTSVFAAWLAFHNVAARNLAVLGREGVLPPALGRITGSAPRTASLGISALSLVVIAVYAFGGVDPLVKLFFWGSSTGALGILLLMALASAAVIGFFARSGLGESLWHRVIAPALATIVLGGAGWTALRHLDALFGPDSTSATRAVQWAFAAAVIIGIAWGLTLRRTKPEVYAGIGTGEAPPPAHTLTTILADNIAAEREVVG